MVFFCLILNMGYILAPADAKVTKRKRLPIRFWVLSVLIILIFLFALIEYFQFVYLSNYVSDWDGDKYSEFAFLDLTKYTLHTILMVIIPIVLIIAGLYSSLRFSLSSILSQGKRIGMDIVSFLAVWCISGLLVFFNNSMAAKFAGFSYISATATNLLFIVLIIFSLIFAGINFLFANSVRKATDTDQIELDEDGNAEPSNFKQYFNKFYLVAGGIIFFCCIVLMTFA